MTYAAPTSRLVLQALLVLAALYTLYFARTLLMPMVVALFFALLLSPLVEYLKRFYIPRSLSALLMLCLIGGPLGLLFSQLSEPAQRWAQEIPELTEQLSKQLEQLTTLEPEQGPEPASEPAGFSFFGLFGDEMPEIQKNPPKDSSGLTEKLKQGSLEALIAILSAAPLIVAQLLTAIMLTLFLLIFGSGLLATWARVFPGIENKELSLDVMHSVQLELSRYILTVSVINALLGLLVAAVLWAFGVQDALLWGALVGTLNFAPYVGPLIGVIILCLAGVVQYGLVMTALLPAAVYFSINMLEAQVITPLILGRNMRLNPLVIIVWLVIWGWLWGAVGVLLAVPMLVCIKIAAKQTRHLQHWIELIETRA